MSRQAAEHSTIPCENHLKETRAVYTAGMPPSSPHQPETDTDFMLPEGHPDRAGKSGNGAVIGVVIIVILLIFGALYFWGAQLNRDSGTLPFIPGDAATTTAQ